MLSLLIIIPLITALGILFSPPAYAKKISLAGGITQLLWVLTLLYFYQSARADGHSEAFLFQQQHTWFASLNINYHVGVDGISLAMLILTALVVLAGVLVSWQVTDKAKEYFLLLNFLALGAYGFFISLDLFTLFFFLEVAVIPKFLLIGIWGSGKKEYSAMKLALMLMAGSALVFVGIAGIYFNSNNVGGLQSFSLQEIATLNLPLEIQQLFFPFAFIGFGIFTALFPFHTWVPDGHSSAPTAASMFLAGISMKLGGYGCLRVATYLMPDAAQFYAPVIIVLAIIAILYGAFATMMQTDLKYMNAYSSVSHCGFVLLGIGLLTKTAINGAVIQMVSHGLMTALFFAAIGMIYSRTHTRTISQLGGLLKITPFISTVFVIAGLASLGLPGLSGFIAEMTVFMGGWQKGDTFYRFATILACASIVVTAVYILRATGQVIMGPLQVQNREVDTKVQFDAAWNEKLAAGLLIAGILVIGLAPFWILKLVQPGTENIMMKMASIFSN